MHGLEDAGAGVLLMLLEGLFYMLNRKGGAGVIKGFTAMVFEQGFKGRLEFARQCGGYGEGESLQIVWARGGSHVIHMLTFISCIFLSIICMRWLCL